MLKSSYKRVSQAPQNASTELTPLNSDLPFIYSITKSKVASLSEYAFI